MTADAIADARLRSDQRAAIEELAGRSNRPRAEVIRQLIDIGLFILTGVAGRAEE